MDADKLAQMAALLKVSSHFVNHTETSPYSEKQSIFLVLAGKKPVSQATSSRWVKNNDGAHAEPDSHQVLSEFLKLLGLVFELHSDEHFTDALVALRQEDISSYITAENAGDVSAIGRLFGYPESAVTAFARDELMDLDEQDALISAAGIPIDTVSLPLFRFSRMHARDELKVIMDWYNTLKLYDLV